MGKGEEMKFKVGDRVKIVMHWNTHYRKRKGEVIQAIPREVEFPGLESTGIYKIVLDGDREQMSVWAQDDNLELI